MITRFFFASTAAALVTVASVGALADEEETEGARLFREGRALMKAERFDEACPKLEESQRKEPRGGTLLNLAACHERQGKVASAWAEFHDALAAARADGKAERVRLAEERIAALGPRVPWLVINVTAEAAAQGARVTFDGAEIQRFAWGKDMPIDPGEHALVISAAGRVEEKKTFAIREGERQTIDVASLAEIAKAPEPVDPELPPPAKTPEPQAPKLGRWVFEAGLSAAYMTASLGNTYPDAGESSIKIQTPNGPGNCGYASCSYSLGRRSSLVGTVNLFAGFAARDWLHIGGRVLTGPRLRGGAVFATGPSVSLHMWGPLWIGGSLYLGYASHSESSGGTITLEPGSQLASNEWVPMTASTEMAAGLGAELRCELFRSARGALAVDMQPFFLSGDRGAAFVLPFGVSYRWR